MTDRERSGRWALLVAIGILLSRIAGLIRDRVFAHYFGNSDAADAFRAALRIPNFLQNLFGEGVLSASFIPVYAKLLAQGDTQEARRVAGAVATLLALTVSALVALGLLATPWLIDTITPGFTGSKRELTQRLVAILFPGTGLLVMSAWCLGILNSHRHFFLSYVAPVLWNLAIIAALICGGGNHDQYALAEFTAWGAVVGGALQWLVQLPKALTLTHGVALTLGLRIPEVRTVIRNFFPALLGRGVVQISAYVDAVIASLLPTGSLAALSYAQTLYLLPVSLFGMSNAIAELPEMSSALGNTESVAAQLRSRLQAGLRRIAFFIVPSTVGLLLLGNVIVAAVYQTGQFSATDARYVWSVLAGAAVGLLASTLGRLYASSCYALRDTRTPLRYAVVRVLLAASLAYLFSQHLPTILHLDPRWGIVGVALASSLAGWLEFLLLRRAVTRRLGATRIGRITLAKLWLAAVLAGITAGEIEWVLPAMAPIASAVIVLGVFGLLYLASVTVLGVDQARTLLRRIRR
jgi:putative peptidoglycan lipid II flippase